MSIVPKKTLKKKVDQKDETPIINNETTVEKSSFEQLFEEDLSIEHIQKGFFNIIDELNTLSKEQKNIKPIIKNIKFLKKYVETLHKKKKTNKKIINPDRKQAGLEQEKTVIQEFTNFYNSEVRKNKSYETFPYKENDTQFSRVQITKLLCLYISIHKLQNMENKTKINPDEKLIKLLKLEPLDIENLKYATLQKHIGKLLIQTPKTN